MSSTAWCSEIGSLTSQDAYNSAVHPVTSENQFHCTKLCISSNIHHTTHRLKHALVLAAQSSNSAQTNKEKQNSHHDCQGNRSPQIFTIEEVFVSILFELVGGDGTDHEKSNSSSLRTTEKIKLRANTQRQR